MLAVVKEGLALFEAERVTPAPAIPTPVPVIPPSAATFLQHLAQYAITPRWVQSNFMLFRTAWEGSLAVEGSEYAGAAK